MQSVPNSIFAFPQMQALLEDERRLIDRRAARLAAPSVLAIDPHADCTPVLASARHAAIRLHVVERRLAGSQACAPDALPWAEGHFDLVVARHVADALPPDCAIEAELARVLAPGGTLILAGLNPLSPWRLWWSRECRNGLRAPATSNPAWVGRRFDALGLDVVDRAFVGGLWPRRASNAIELAAEGDGSRWHGAWLLVVHKRATSVRPIPLRRTARRAALAPSLVPSSSGRLRA